MKNDPLKAVKFGAGLVAFGLGLNLPLVTDPPAVLLGALLAAFGICLAITNVP